MAATNSSGEDADHSEPQTDDSGPVVDLVVRRANGEPLRIPMAPALLPVLTVEQLRPMIAEKIGAPAGVINVIDVEEELADVGTRACELIATLRFQIQNPPP